MAKLLDEITYEQYLEARLTIATVEADWDWKQHQIAGMPVHRPTATETGAMDGTRAAKYISVGKSKFYELIRDGELPEGADIGGRPKWLRVDLDKYLAKRKRKGPG